MKYQFITEHRQEYPISTMCRVLEVAVSGFYAWRRRAPSRRGPREYGGGGAHCAHLSGEPPGLWQSAHSCSRCRAEGRRCGRKRVARLMREHGLSAKARLHRTRTTDSQHEHPVAPHLLTRDFTASAPTTRWVADITGVWTWQGWLSLAVVLDIFSRLVVGWAMDQHRDEALVEQAALLALARRHRCRQGYCIILTVVASTRLRTTEHSWLAVVSS